MVCGGNGEYEYGLAHLTQVIFLSQSHICLSWLQIFIPSIVLLFSRSQYVKKEGDHCTGLKVKAKEKLREHK